VHHAGDLDLDDITGGQRTDPLGCPGQDEVTRLEGHDLADVADEIRNREDHVAHMAVLADLAVDASDDLEVVPVEAAGHECTDGTEGVEALRPGPLAVQLLQVARGDVIGAGDTGHMGDCLRFAHLARGATDHHDDLGLVLHAR
jgi:hypothetical protein